MPRIRLICYSSREELYSEFLELKEEDIQQALIYISSYPIEDILLIVDCSLDGELEGQIYYLPL